MNNRDCGYASLSNRSLLSGRSRWARARYLCCRAADRQSYIEDASSNAECLWEVRLAELPQAYENKLWPIARLAADFVAAYQGEAASYAGSIPNRRLVAMASEAFR